MLPLPITRNDAKFLLNGEEIGTVKEFKGEIEADKPSEFIELLNPKTLFITGRIDNIRFTRGISLYQQITDWKNSKYRRKIKYIRRCNRWRSKNNLELLRW